MKKVFILVLGFCLSSSVLANVKGLSLSVYGGMFLPFQPNLSDTWSEPYLKMPYLYTIENKYHDTISTTYGMRIGYYFFNKSGIYISYDTTNKDYSARYVGKYPNPKSPNILRTLEVEDNIRFNIFETSIGFKHKYVNNKQIVGETFIGITVFHGTPTFLKDITVFETKNHKFVKLKSTYFFDKHFHTVGINAGMDLYKKIYKGLKLGLVLKYVYGNFKIEKEERDNFIVPLQSFKVMFGLMYSI